MIEEINKVAINSITENGFNSLHATRNFNNGDIITAFSTFKIVKTPSRYTIQAGEDQHIELAPAILRFVNHSCHPNAYFDFLGMNLLCLEEISAGDCFTCFYPATEWEMKEPFNCHCESENCLNIIKGAAFLPQHLINKFMFTDFILKKLHLLHG